MQASLSSSSKAKRIPGSHKIPLKTDPGWVSEEAQRNREAHPSFVGTRYFADKGKGALLTPTSRASKGHASSSPREVSKSDHKKRIQALKLENKRKEAEIKQLEAKTLASRERLKKEALLADLKPFGIDKALLDYLEQKYLEAS